MGELISYRKQELLLLIRNAPKGVTFRSQALIKDRSNFKRLVRKLADRGFLYSWPVKIGKTKTILYTLTPKGSILVQFIDDLNGVARKKKKVTFFV